MLLRCRLAHPTIRPADQAEPVMKNFLTVRLAHEGTAMTPMTMTLQGWLADKKVDLGRGASQEEEQEELEEEEEEEGWEEK